MESDTLIDEMWCIYEEGRWRRDNDQIEQAHGTWKVAGSLNHNSRPITLSIASPLRNVNQLNLAKSPRLMKSFAKLIVPSCYLDSWFIFSLRTLTMDHAIHLHHCWIRRTHAAPWTAPPYDHLQRQHPDQCKAGQGRALRSDRFHRWYI